MRLDADGCRWAREVRMDRRGGGTGGVAVTVVAGVPAEDVWPPVGDQAGPVGGATGAGAGRTMNAVSTAAAPATARPVPAASR